MTGLQIGFWAVAVVIVGLWSAAWVMKRKADAVERRRAGERAGD